MAEPKAQKQESTQAVEQLQTKGGQKVASYNEQLNVLAEELAYFGGFQLLEAVVDGVQNISPERKARKQIFLNDADRAEDRSKLLRRLQIWHEMLNNQNDIAAIIASCEEKAHQYESNYKKNVKDALVRTRDMETNWRAVQLFYKNTEEDKLKNVSIMNADIEQIKDLDLPVFIDKVSDELQDNFDRLDLRENYSILVIPGYLGSNKLIEKWSKIAHKNRVLLVTDFENFETPDDVMEMFEAAKLTGGDVHRSNTIMTCNWLIGREKNDEVGEDQAVFVPPSAALAGKIYSTLMSQVTAGKKYGGLSEVDGVRFDLRKSEIADLEYMGLVPMVNEYAKVMAFSAKTLFNGDNLGLQTYSVVRVFDWVAKVLMDFLNRRAFENFTINSKRDIMDQINRFLDNIKGHGKLIEDFKIMRFEQDPKQKDRVWIDIHMKPFFPAKNFLIKLEGHKGDEAAEWAADYQQV